MAHKQFGSRHRQSTCQIENFLQGVGRVTFDNKINQIKYSHFIFIATYICASFAFVQADM